MHIKTEKEIATMREGGRMLGKIRDDLISFVRPGRTAWDLELLANSLIKKTGGKPSFKMVPGYDWATCVNVNEVVVHGIPKKTVVFKEGDVVSVDVGLYYKGYHTDTSDTVYLGNDKEVKRFLKEGKRVWVNAIAKALPGNRVSDISREMQKVEELGYFVIRELVGHGIGKKLHEKPEIPCYVSRAADKILLEEGMVIAIEIMYAMGKPDICIDKDGWTLSVRNGKITALYEETVVVSSGAPEVITAIGRQANLN